MSILMKYANNADRESLANRLRRKRFALFQSLLEPLPRPIRILDIGGTAKFWETMGFADPEEVAVTILNVRLMPTDRPGFTAVTGDARDLKEYADGAFDVVFSNSVIEHVGPLADQQRMADEVRRVGTRYFVQTPNRWFPIEPHFLLPYFQFYPLGLKIWLMRHFALGYAKAPIPDKDAAREAVDRVWLLSRRQFHGMFPGANLHEEKVAGLTKSFVAYGGWGT